MNTGTNEVKIGKGVANNTGATFGDIAASIQSLDSMAVGEL